ncbi:MAG: hypothetical protein C4340_01195 [Armatimonadota bacterium]
MTPEPISESHPLREMMLRLVRDSVRAHVGGSDEDAEAYIASIVIRFAHTDASALQQRDREVDDLVEMLALGDIRLAAQSFDDERRVHKHIGDYLLFWEGLYPEHLRRMRRQGRPAGLVDPILQGKSSYYVVSTFRFGEYAEEADLFERLSEAFVDYLRALRSLRGEIYPDEPPGSLPV